MVLGQMMPLAGPKQPRDLFSDTKAFFWVILFRVCEAMSGGQLGFAQPVERYGVRSMTISSFAEEAIAAGCQVASWSQRLSAGTHQDMPDVARRELELPHKALGYLFRRKCLPERVQGKAETSFFGGRKQQGRCPARPDIELSLHKTHGTHQSTRDVWTGAGALETSVSVGRCRASSLGKLEELIPPPFSLGGLGG